MTQGISASSGRDDAWKAYDKQVHNSWLSAATYNDGVCTECPTMDGSSGEYVEIDIGRKALISSFRIQFEDLSQTPQSFALWGRGESNEGWTLVRQGDTTLWAQQHTARPQLSQSQQGPWRYLRHQVTKIGDYGAQASAQISEIRYYESVVQDDVTLGISVWFKFDDPRILLLSDAQRRDASTVVNPSGAYEMTNYCATGSGALRKDSTFGNVSYYMPAPRNVIE